MQAVPPTPPPHIKQPLAGLFLRRDFPSRLPPATMRAAGSPAQVDLAASDLQSCQLVSPEHTRHATKPVPAPLTNAATRIDGPSSAGVFAAAPLRDQSD
ncbi:hypothetical protein IWW57_005033, partial [Coemansia sp. S610]